MKKLKNNPQVDKPSRKTMEDIEVEKMLNEWDRVNCFYCGKEISIINAKTTLDGRHFVCKSDCCG